MENKSDRPLSEKEDEILEFIGKLYEIHQQKTIKRIDLAKDLHCSPSLINKLLISLENRKLITHEKYGEIAFTEEGLTQARNLIRKHRLSESLFVKILGMNPSEVHDYACKFEHVMDDNLANRIDAVLKNPNACPHGNPISSSKTKEGAEFNPLNSFSASSQVQVMRIRNESSDFLKKLYQAGIEVGVKVRIIEKSFDGTFLVEINGKKLPLSEETAQNLLVISL
ncbi:MAG: metal-dependent transcriptional regulator [Candidatus Helarchaeota archaeon]|nr:metal-dependent transcriptional regulator [Candidatus Helarchaeota archaeon]